MFGLIPYSRNENSLWNYFDNIERSFFGDVFSGAQNFRTDIVDKGDAYELNAELPGFSKEDINIDIKDNSLVITARKDENHEESEDNYIRRERRYGSFLRSFDLTGIQAEGITAAYNDGILTLNLPKSQPQPLPPTRQIAIQ